MDDEQVFGPVFHRLGFGEAVEADLLADYKVMVLVVTEEQMAGPLQQMMADDNVELPLDDAAKIMGCWNTLAKRVHPGDPHPAFPPDADPHETSGRVPGEHQELPTGGRRLRTGRCGGRWTGRHRPARRARPTTSTAP